MSHIQPGLYQHYKGDLCEVIGVARHSETLEEVVVYYHLSGASEYGEKSLWIRPKAMFLEEVIHNGVRVPRFSFLK